MIWQKLMILVPGFAYCISFLFPNILIDPRREGKCVKHRLAILLQKMFILQIKMNSIYLYLLDGSNMNLANK